MKSLSTFEDLSKEDKAKVIGGFIAVGVAIVGFLAFIQFSDVNHRLYFSENLDSASSLLIALPYVLAVMYLLTILPMIVAGGVAMGLLAKRSFRFVIEEILGPPLLATGGMFGLSALLLTLFGVLFSNLSEAAQAVLMVLAFSVSGIIVASVLKTNRTNRYIRKKTG